MKRTVSSLARERRMCLLARLVRRRVVDALIRACRWALAVASPSFPTQAGTHHPRRTDKEPPSLCTVNTPLGQVSCFPPDYFPPSPTEVETRNLKLTETIFPYGSSDKYSSAPAPGRTIFWRHAARASLLSLSFSLSHVMLICIKGKEKKNSLPSVSERGKTHFV